jgi:hypothetical protein
MPKTHLLLSVPDPEAAQRLHRVLHRQAPDCTVIESAGQCSQRPACRWLHPLPPASLGQVTSDLSDAISVLERSRHAFKSAQLAALRKRLGHLLEELSASDNCGKS